MATITPILPKLEGARTKRREDPRLIRSRGTHVDANDIGAIVIFWT